jgi:hypothetical protein
MKLTLATVAAVLMAVPSLVAGAPTGDHEKRQSFPTSVTYDDPDTWVLGRI